jgi:hypothetical protein
MDRVWVCKELSCEGAVIRSYDSIVANGEPYCPICESDMQLTKATCKGFDHLSKPVRL